MRHDFRHRDAEFWVLLKHPSQEIARSLVNVVGHLKVAVFDLLKKCADVLVVKRQAASEKSKENNTTRPNVARCSIVSLAGDNLWRGVVRASARSLEHALIILPRGHAKVCHLDVLISVEKQVFWFQITMANVEAMAVVDSKDNLLEIVQCLGWWKSSSTDQVVEELASSNILNNEVSKAVSRRAGRQRTSPSLSPRHHTARER